MNEQVLTDEQVELEVEKLNVAWSHIPGQGLMRVFETHNFAEGLALVDRIGQLAEEKGHHPDITLRYDEVEVTTFTHDVGGITQEDLNLAKAVDDLVG